MSSVVSSASLGLVLAFASSSNAQLGQSPFLPRSRPCPCVDSCIYQFADPVLPNFDAPARGADANQVSLGNSIVSADGSPVEGCDGDVSAFLNDDLDWTTTVFDANGVPQPINKFSATEDALFTVPIDDDVFDGYDELNGRLIRTELTCNNGDSGCVYFTVGADDFVCPCPLDIEVPITVDHELLGGVILDVPSEGSGIGRIMYDPVTREMNWEIETTDLSSDLQQIHFHGPASPLEGGALMINATLVGNPPLGRTGTMTLNETQGRDLVDGRWYINIHTDLNPSGELRGNIVVPDMEVPITVDHELLGGVVLLEPSLGSGTGLINYDPETRLMSWDMRLNDLSSDLMQIHFHGPATPLEGGALMINATDVGVPPLGRVGAQTLTPDQARDFEAGTWYINIHTDLNPSGELRGNIMEPDAIIDCNVDAERAGGVVLLEDSVGYGSGRLNYDMESRLLVWDIRTQNLAGPLMQLHFHGPAPLDDTGDLQINATLVGVPPLGRIGAMTLTPEQEDALLSEGWYINIHTDANPSGELRGNILAPALDEAMAVDAQAAGVIVNADIIIPVVAGVIGGGGAVCIFCAAALFCLRKNKDKKKDAKKERFTRRESRQEPERRLSGNGPESERDLAGSPRRETRDRRESQTRDRRDSHRDSRPTSRSASPRPGPAVLAQREREVPEYSRGSGRDRERDHYDAGTPTIMSELGGRSVQSRASVMAAPPPLPKQHSRRSIADRERDRYSMAGGQSVPPARDAPVFQGGDVAFTAPAAASPMQRVHTRGAPMDHTEYRTADYAPEDFPVAGSGRDRAASRASTGSNATSEQEFLGRRNRSSSRASSITPASTGASGASRRGSKPARFLTRHARGSEQV